MGKLVLFILSAISSASLADTWQIDGKIFTEKANAIRYVLTHQKDLNSPIIIKETRDVVMTDNLAFKKVKTPKKKKTKT